MDDLRDMLIGTFGLSTSSPELDLSAVPNTTPQQPVQPPFTPMSGPPVGMSPPDTVPTAQVGNNLTLSKAQETSSGVYMAPDTRRTPTSFRTVGTGVQSTLTLVHKLVLSENPQASYVLGAILTVLRKRLTENKQYCKENSHHHYKNGIEPFFERIEKHIKDKMHKRTIDSAAELVDQIWLGMELAQHLGYAAELAHLMRGVAITGSRDNSWGETKGDHVPPPHDKFTTLRHGLKLGQKTSNLDTDREQEFREKMATALSLRPHLTQPIEGTRVKFALDPADYDRIVQELGDEPLPFSTAFNTTEIGRDYTKLCTQHGSEPTPDGKHGQIVLHTTQP